jgi:hypothetical protein
MEASILSEWHLVCPKSDPTKAHPRLLTLNS